MLVAPVSVDISFNFGVMSQVSWTRAGTWHSAHPQYGGHSGKQRTEDDEDSLPSYVKTEKSLSSRKRSEKL